MRRLIFCLIICCLCFCSCSSRPQEDVKQTDTTFVEKKLYQWSDSLNTRDFSKDVEALKKDIKEAADKTKESIERHTPEVRKLFKSLGEYLRR